MVLHGFVWGTLALNACATVASSARPREVQPERPSVATHAGTVAPRYLELETGAERDRNSDGAHATQIPSVLKFGVSPRTQLSLVLPASSADDVKFGLGDAAVAFKWRVLEDHPWLSDVAIQPTLKFSTGGERGTGTTDGSLLLINSRELGPAGLDLNVGVTRRSGDGERAPRFASLWTAAVAVPLRGPLALALECYGYPGTSGPAGSAPIVALLVGPTYQLRAELALDAGIIEPVAGPQPRAFYIGLVANLGRLR